MTSSAGLPVGVTLRALTAADLEAVAAALQPAEGYTLASPPTLDEVRADLAGFGADALRRGLVAETAGAALAGVLLYIERDRGRDDFGPGALIAQLPAARFPPDGRFLQVFDLWVAHLWRRQGLAESLKLALERDAKAQGFGMIYTVTEAENVAARRLNARLGYEPLYEGPMWDDVPRIALAKYL